MKSNRTAFVIVGTVALIGGLIALSLNTPAPLHNGMSFLSQHSDVEKAFIQFLAKFGKSYASKEELPMRFENFKKTYEMVQTHNNKIGVQSKLEINKFADMNKEEFTTGASLPQDIEFFDVQRLASITDMNVTNSVDWSLTNKVGPVRDQGKCQACWAFSAASALGSALSIMNNESIHQNEISVQHLIDCDIYNAGCNRGSMWNAYRYILKKGYVKWNEYAYDYLGMQRACQTPAASSMLKPSYLLPVIFPPLSVQNMMLLVSFQPVSVAINTPDCLRSYKTGVLREEDCECTSRSYFGADIEQSAVVVGYALDIHTLGCQGYWIVKNSWGTEWGEHGYVRLCIPVDSEALPLGMCNVLAFPQIPHVGIFSFD